MARLDRIAEPWGTRTPYGAGEAWPARVDSYLSDGLTEEDVDRWVQSASILHSNGDGIDIAVKASASSASAAAPATASTTAGSIPRTSTAGRPTARPTG